MDRKTQQFTVLGIGAVCIAGLGFLVFGVLGPEQPTANPFGAADSGVDVSIIADRTSAAAPEMSWVVQSRADLENLTTLVEDLQASLDAERQEGERQIVSLRAEYDEIIIQMAENIALLESAAIAGTSSGPTVTVDEATGELVPVTTTPDYSDTGSEFIEQRTNRRVVPTPPGPLGDGRRQIATTETDEQDPMNAQRGSFGQVFTLTSTESSGDGRRNTLRNYIPAGSYAEAVVLSGADAATNVVNRENPIPVLFRVTGPAITAARGGRDGARVNIEGCTVQGSAIGDLSSERVRVRLLSLTCIARNGDVIETAISGYMVGSGKEGVRGQVVSREGPLVTNAAIAGALQGLASAVTPQPEDGIDSVSEIAQNAAAAAGAGGLQTAASTLSEYYINRAEQYQPVITLNGGTRVELVFLEGVSLQ